MNRNLMILAGAVVVVAGIAVGLLLAGGLSSDALEGALYDDTPGPWLFAPGTIIGSPAPDAGPEDALYIVEQYHEEIGPSRVPNTQGADCYIVAPMVRADPSANEYDFPGCARSDMLVLASSVVAAPAAVRTSTGCLRYTVPAPEGVPSTVSDASLVGKTIMRRDDDCLECGNPSNCYPTYITSTDCTVEASGYTVAEHLVLGDSSGSSRSSGSTPGTATGTGRAGPGSFGRRKTCTPPPPTSAGTTTRSETAAERSVAGPASPAGGCGAEPAVDGGGDYRGHEPTQARPGASPYTSPAAMRRLQGPEGRDGNGRVPPACGNQSRRIDACPWSTSRTGLTSHVMNGIIMKVVPRASIRFASVSPLSSQRAKPPLASA